LGRAILLRETSKSVALRVCSTEPYARNCKTLKFRDKNKQDEKDKLKQITDKLARLRMMGY